MAKDHVPGVSRRRLVHGIGGLAAASIAAPALLRPAAAQGKTLYVNTWGGSWTAAEEAAYFKPFTDETGIRIRTVAPVSYAKLKAQVTTRSYEWDVTAIEQGELRRAEREGLIEPIDWRIVQRDKLFPGAEFANGIAACALGTTLAYRADKYPGGGPKNWSDFWNVEKFPGPRAMINNPVRALVFALAADGVPVDKIFPLDIDRAFRKLDQVKKHIKVWWTQGNQSQQLIRDGEVHMMAMWNARVSELKAQGVPVEVVWDGATIHTTMWCVAKGAPNRDLAWQFIQFAVQPKPQAEFCNRLFYGPSNPEAFKFVNPAIADQMPTHPQNRKVAVSPDPEWFADNAAKVQERFTQWVAS
jgi:putative spermidine/putrescine transport system substrate-binding protein